MKTTTVAATSTIYPHITWLTRYPHTIKSIDQKKIIIYEFCPDKKDKSTLSKWAKHFREHYCFDTKIDRLRKGTGKSRAEYLIDLVFPDKTEDFGPATRSGDFAEILISDILEGIAGYWVPRTRYADKKVRNESPKGTDIIGFKLINATPSEISLDDKIITFESKAQLSGTRYKARLQDAVTDSKKDKFRLAESLNAIKRRLLDLEQDAEADIVERFQDPLDRPYKRISGAAALFCTSIFDANQIGSTTDCSQHENSNNLVLLVVHAASFMEIVHTIYEQAANEA